jgi:hypothetical protein
MTDLKDNPEKFFLAHRVLAKLSILIGNFKLKIFYLVNILLNIIFKITLKYRTWILDSIYCSI